MIATAVGPPPGAPGAGKRAPSVRRGSAIGPGERPPKSARRPPEARGIARDQVRLSVVHGRRAAVEHRRFDEMPQLLRRSDLLVVNRSATLPAALSALVSSGARATLHLSTRIGRDLWSAELREPLSNGGTRELFAGRPGLELALDGGASARMLRPYDRAFRPDGVPPRLWVVRLGLPDPLLPYLQQHGQPVRYAYVEQPWPLSCYQTVFSRYPGSAEMPSAGRPFSLRLLERMQRRGVQLASIVLHTGLSSAEPGEPPYPERYLVPQATVEAVARARRSGGRVIAVGTTVVRALESWAVRGQQPRGSDGWRWTDHIVTPASGVRVVDGLVTGMHEPTASHHALLRALTPPPLLERALREMLQIGYLWHEFGDAQLLLP